MANSERRKLNKNGFMFIPMNVENGYWNDSFMTTGKWIILAIAFFGNVFTYMWLSSQNAAWTLYVFFTIVLAYINLLVLRFFIFEENYYYRIYKKMKKQEVTTPAMFWDIVSITNTEDGAKILYSNLRTAVILRLERDTIIGKPEQFKETHYDAISDFYKALNQKEYKYIQMNIMEQAGKDPRLQTLNELITSANNKNISKLIEQQIGYIKTITSATLYENDYFLIYTDNIRRSDTLINDVLNCSQILLNGGFIDCEILQANNVVELVKNYYNVNYFDYTDAVVSIYKNNNFNVLNAFDIVQVNYKNGKKVDYKKYLKDTKQTNALSKNITNSNNNVALDVDLDNNLEVQEEVENNIAQEEISTTIIDDNDIIDF